MKIHELLDNEYVCSFAAEKGVGRRETNFHQSGVPLLNKIIFMSKCMLLAVAFLCCGLPAVAQGDKHVLVSEEPTEDGAVLYIENIWMCPYTVEFDAELTNVRTDQRLPLRVVVPAGTRMELLRLIPKPYTRWGYRYNYNYYMGDAVNARHDDNYVYQLPFEQNALFTVGQGYNGEFSHRGEKALDFVMPVGTPVHAARGGVVIKVRSDSNRGCASESCRDDGNFLLIYHEDGSIANYAHFKFRGIVVREGDVVNRGQLIGYSGNTGWSSGPHLHFQVYLPGFGNKRTSVTTYFQTSTSERTLLREKQAYKW